MIAVSKLKKNHHKNENCSHTMTQKNKITDFQWLKKVSL
jgi:hypothetical protein